MFSFQFEEYVQLENELKNLLPEPELEKVEGNRFGYRVFVDEYRAFHLYEQGRIKEYFSYEWVKMYQQVTLKIAKMMMGEDHWYVLKFYPQILHQVNGITMNLYCDINVAMTQNVIVPEYIYENQNSMPIEWRCGHCQSVNEMKERHCTQCGAPRTMLIQEMKSEYMGCRA